MASHIKHSDAERSEATDLYKFAVRQESERLFVMRRLKDMSNDSKTFGAKRSKC
jgi:hypothetical protein